MSISTLVAKELFNSECELNIDYSRTVSMYLHLVYEFIAFIVRHKVLGGY